MIKIANHFSRHPELVSGSVRHDNQMLKQVQHDGFQETATFTDRVYAVVKAIPAGSVLTYSEVAAMVGSPRAARAVGQAMKRNERSFLTAPSETAIPCHRVVGANHRLGGFNAGQKQKIALLETEGWHITQSGRLHRSI